MAFHLHTSMQKKKKKTHKHVSADNCNHTLTNCVFEHDSHGEDGPDDIGAEYIIRCSE